MPRYEHACRACKGGWFESYSIHDTPPKVCPECGSEEVFRVLGTPAFVLKGSGWAYDGYHKNAPLEEAWKGRLKLYDNKEDYVRERVGEAKELERRKLKKQNEVIKRTLNYDSRITESEAERKIRAAGEKAKKEV